MANLKSRPASAPPETALPAATELDDPRPAVLGRGQRDPQPTERSLVFRMYLYFTSLPKLRMLNLYEQVSLLRGRMHV